MKNKILVILLSVILVFSMTGLSFAEELSSDDTEKAAKSEVKTEQAVEKKVAPEVKAPEKAPEHVNVEQKEEVKEEAIKEEAATVDSTFTIKDKPVINQITLECIDNIGTAPEGKVGPVNKKFTYKFKKSSDIPANYKFKYWTGNDCDFEKGDELVIKKNTYAEDVTLTFTAMYQPQVTVNYYAPDGTLIGSITKKKVKLYAVGQDFLDEYYPEEEPGDFDGWFDNDGNKIKQGLVGNYELTSELLEEDFVINAYAKFIVEPDDPDDPDDPIVEPVKPSKEDKDSGKSTAKVENVYGLSDGEDVEGTPIEVKPAKKTIQKTANPIDGKGDGDLGHWALINLICTILTFIIPFLVLIAAPMNRKIEGYFDEETDNGIKRKFFERVTMIGIAILSLVILFLTENFNLPMGMVDGWTILMVVILFIQAAFMFLIKKHYDANEEE